MFGTVAARAALTAPGLELDDIDSVIGASGTPDRAVPSNVALLHRELGVSRRSITAFDVGAGSFCFLMALDVVASLVDSVRYRRVLVVAGVTRRLRHVTTPAAAITAAPALGFVTGSVTEDICRP